MSKYTNFQHKKGNVKLSQIQIYKMNEYMRAQTQLCVIKFYAVFTIEERGTLIVDNSKLNW